LKIFASLHYIKYTSNMAASYASDVITPPTLCRVGR